MQTDEFTTLFVKDAENVVLFLHQKLAFIIINNRCECEHGIGAMICDEYGNNFLVIEQREKDRKAEPIIIHTPDCLQTCYHLSRSATFSSRPHYTDEGLMAEIIDPYGNEYILMERRSILEK